MPDPIGFLGLGDLGRPIARNLMAAGHALTVWNRTAAKGDDLVASGADRAAAPAGAVQPGGIVVSLLWDDASVAEVVESDGFLERLGPGGVHVSMTTVSPAGSKALAARHAEAGVGFVEAPVFGRPEAATARQLWIAYAGAEAAKARVRPLFEAMGAREAFDFGEQVGAATTVKLVGNFLIISAGAAMTEGLAMTRAGGFDAAATIEMLTSTLFPSPIYQAYGRAIAAGTAASGGGSAIPGKDLGLFKASAEAVSSPAPLSSLLLEMRRG